MAKTVLILQSNYIPWKGYFDLIGAADEFVVYDHVQYTKNDWRNRNRIKTQHGVQWITIPVYHSLDARVLDVTVSDSRWNVKHWNTLRGNYSKAAHFHEFKELFEELYLNCKEVRLSIINMLFISAIMKILGIDTRISASTDYELQGDRTERLVELCKRLKATDYVTGPAARDYLDVSLFRKEGINVQFFDYSGYPEYPQVHAPFEHAVSAVDLIFNCGAESGDYMKFRSMRSSVGR